MKTLTLRNRFQGNSIVVENDFIDNYMTKANGEYVKVYLLLLRHLNMPNTALTISKLADCLDCTEKDVLRALKYWSKTGLLKIDYDETGAICGISVGQGSSDSVSETSSDDIAENSQAKSAPKSDSSATNKQLSQLYFVTEQYLGKPLTPMDYQKINYFYDTLHFPIDLIEYLVESCVENGRKTMRSIERVALDWSDKNITTVEEAKEISFLYHKNYKNYYAILKSFGISGRNPASIELNYMKKWLDEYGFTIDIILEACNRTITNTARPDFKYADSILTKWHEQKVIYITDISRLDMAHEQTKAAKKKAPTKAAISGTNRFNNFESRSYDISSLEQQLLNTQ